MTTSSEVERSIGAAEELRRQFDRTGDPGFLTASVEAYAALVAQDPDGATVGLLVRYANAVLARYQAVGGPSDVDLAQQVSQRAVVHAGPARELRAVALNVAANARTASYQARGDTADLMLALSEQRETVELLDIGQKSRVAFAVNLANRLIFAFGIVREPAMLDEAVTVLEALLGEQMPEEWRAGALNNLGLALRARFEVSAESDDLEASLRAQREALDLTGPGEIERVNRLNNLANAWWARYLSTGVLADLDEAIATYAAATQCPGNPTTRAACLLGLGTARWNRWGRRHLDGDLDAAITAFTAAADLVDDASPTAAHCALNLGAAYFARWRHIRQRADLDRAIAYWTGVSASPAAEREVADASRSNLGGALWERHEVTSEIDDLHQAIGLLAARPADGRVTMRPGHLFTLAGALRRRFELRGDAADRDRGIAAYRRACALGLAANPGVALNAGQQWGAWAAARASLPEADEAFTWATAAAANVYSGQQLDEHTQVWLGEALTLAARHALVQVRRDRPASAVLTLERSRAYVLSEALDRRQDR